MERKAVFLDRDGVLLNNQDAYYIYKTEDYRINEGVVSGLSLLIEKGFILIVISNQGGISKGLYTKQDTDLIHNRMTADFKKDGIEITGWFYCPHHTEIERCLCRKPSPLMIEKAIAKFGIDTANSYFIGDSLSDMEAASGAGINPVKAEPNHGFYELCKTLAGEMQVF
jgi:D-glycero-D-manno-heptose 1,7-bisphosphate phosphatase